jgi:hypothetical protein
MSNNLQFKDNLKYMCIGLFFVFVFFFVLHINSKPTSAYMEWPVGDCPTYRGPFRNDMPSGYNMPSDIYFGLNRADCNPYSPTVQFFATLDNNFTTLSTSVPYGTASVGLAFHGAATVGWSPSSALITRYTVVGSTSGVSGIVGEYVQTNLSGGSNTRGWSSRALWNTFTYSPPGGFTASGNYPVTLFVKVAQSFSNAPLRCVANNALASDISGTNCPNSGVAFNINVTVTNIPVRGCTDPAATNYNPSATVNDGSCVYPPPSCSISYSVRVGGFTLSWSSSNASSASLSGVGGVAVNGSANVGATSTTYTLTVSGLGGTRSCSTTTSVPPAPTCTLTYSVVGTSYRLSWSTTNTTSRSINNGIGSVGVSGTSDVSQIAATYVLTVTNSIGTTVSCSRTTVAAPNCTLTDNYDGTSLRISWTTTNATSISIDQGIGNVTPVAGGNRVVSPVVTTTYTATASNSVGATRTCATVVVPPPNISVTSWTCDQITVSFSGESYFYDLELLINGASVGISRSNQRAPGTITFTEVANYKDFTPKNFTVRVTNTTDSTLTRTTPPQSIGPCATLTCNLVPLNIEAGVTFDLVMTLVVSNFGSSGFATTATASVSSNPVLVSGTMDPAAGYSVGANGNYPFRVNNVTASTAGIYSITVNVIGLGGVTCPPIPMTIYDTPYSRLYGNDIIACGTPTSNLVRFSGGYDLSSDPAGPDTYRGAAAQLAVFAANQITGIMSGSQYTGRYTPWDLAFANDGTVSSDLSSLSFGGGISACPLGLDYNVTTDVARSNITGSVDSGIYNWAGGDNIRGSIGEGKRVVILVAGNITITKNGGGAFGPGITYDDVDWTNLNQIPSFTLIATGNIYIDNNVVQLDGHYVAGGDIYTCTRNSSGVWEDLTLAETESGASRPRSDFVINGCNTPLVVNGSFKANKIHFLRSNGSVRFGSAYEDYSSSNIAEVFRFSPEIYLTNGGGINQNTTSTTKFDSIVARPPAF